MVKRILVCVGAMVCGAAVGAAVSAAKRRKKVAAPLVTAEQKASELFQFQSASAGRVNHLHEIKQQRAVVDGEHPLNGWYSQAHFSESLKQWVTIAANKTGEAVVVITAGEPGVNEDGYNVLTYKVPGANYERAINILVHHTKKDGDVDGIWPELHVLALETKEPRTKWMSKSDTFYYMVNVGRVKQSA
jgi:hypothetical protein